VIEFSRYDLETGRIVARGRCPGPAIEWQQDDSTGLITGRLDPERVMVVAGEVVDRPTFPIAVDRTTIAVAGNEAATFTGIPRGTEVVISGADSAVLTVDDGTLAFDADMPGQFVITFELWPYQTLRVTVDAI